MLKEILQREDIKELLQEINTNPNMQKKDNVDSLIYLDTVGIEPSLLILFDALYKYKIILDDVYLLDDYISQLKRLMRKLDNYHDIELGLNRVIGRLVITKLGLNEQAEDEVKEKVLSYIYDKYIVNGYLFFAISEREVEDIRINGLKTGTYLPVEYQQIKEIFQKYNLEIDFSSDIKVTDNFMMASFTAYSYPSYLEKMVCNKEWMKSKKYDLDAYFRRDFTICLKNLLRLCKEKGMNEKETKICINFFTCEWKRLKNDKAKPTLALIKRSALGKDKLKDFSRILKESQNEDLYSSILKIIDSKYTNDPLEHDIEKENIEFLSLINYREQYQSQVLTDLEQVEYDEKIIEENTDKEFLNNYGVTSILLLVGSLLITLGVTITIIMMR